MPSFSSAVAPALCYAGIVGSGLIGGVFFAFSSFVMKALVRQPAPAGLAAMQSINVVVLNPLFLGLFIGTAVVALASIVAGGLAWSKPGAACLLIAGALYLVGTFGVTAACNVPLNDALANVSLDAPDAAARWSDYVTTWTRWNHVRTLAATVSLVFYAVALRSWVG